MQAHVLLTLTLKASGAVAAGRAVAFGGSQVAAAGGLAVGIARTEAAGGEDFAVDAKGTAIAVAGGAVAVGDELVAAADGRLIANPEVGGEHVIGHALTAAAAAGNRFEALLR